MGESQNDGRQARLSFSWLRRSWLRRSWLRRLWLRRLWLRRRSPRTFVFTGVLAVWLVAFFTTPIPGDEPVPGQYSPMLARGDGHYMYLSTISIVFDRDVDLDNQLGEHGDPFGLGERRTITGRHWTFPIGTAILQAPFFAVAHGLASTANVVADVDTGGYSLFYQRVTFLGGLGAGFLALVFGYLIARRYTSETAALYAVIIVGLGSNLLFYSTYRGSYSHAWSAMAVAALLWYWDSTRGQTGLRRFAILGALVGLCALTRMQEVVVCVLPIGEAVMLFAASARRRDTRTALQLAGAGLLATGVALLVVSPQLVVQARTYGGLLTVPQGETFMRWDAPFLWEVLFATRNGLFVWTPLIYLASLGLLLAPARARLLAGSVAIVFFLQLWVNGSTWSWWGDSSFSARRMLGLASIWMLGAAFFVHRIAQLHARWPRFTRHAAFVALLAPLLIMNIELSNSIVSRRESGNRTQRASEIYGKSLRRISQTVGNPTSWPRNWIWAATHGAALEDYEFVVGSELLLLDHRDVGVPGTRRSSKLALDEERVKTFTRGPWRPHAALAGRSAAEADSGARILVPLMVAEHVTLRLTVFRRQPGAVTFTVNGEPAGEAQVGPAWTEVMLATEPGVLRVGTNTVSILCDGPADPCAGIERLDALYVVPDADR